MIADFTTVVALDAPHLEELRHSWPTWVKNRPEIIRQPLKLLVDERCKPYDFVSCLNHPDAEVIPVPDDGTPQRDRMLSSLVLIAAWFMTTKWLLKLDADAVAMRHSLDWCDEEVVKDSIEGTPVLVASGWNYTKPADAIKRLDDWADTVPELKDKPRLDLPVSPGSNKVITKGRIISYVCFGLTSWLQWAAGLCRSLPVCSHDTYLWYVARRHGDYFRMRQMKGFGWSHVRRKNLESMSRKALAIKWPANLERSIKIIV